MNTKAISFSVTAGWALALFTGCSSMPSVGPDYREPEFNIPAYALPDAGAPTTNFTATCEYRPAVSNEDVRVEISRDELTKWWERFDDPILVELIDSAQTNNLNYLMTIWHFEQTKYEILGAEAEFLPKFGLGGDFERRWANKSTTANGNGQNGYHVNTKQLGLDGNWEIDLFGGNRRQWEAAIAQSDAAGWGVDDAWISLTTQIGTQYITLRTIQARIEVARTNLVLQSETYDILKSRLDSGIGDELAVNQCAYIVEQTRANIPQLLAQEESLKNSLAILAGRLPGELEDELSPVAERRDWLLAPQKVSEIPLDLMRARPDVKAAERQLAAATARIGVAKAQWFPRLVISGSVGLQARNSVNLFSRDAFLASLGPSISWPIFQGGAIYANVKAMEAMAESAALGYELALENAYGDVRTAYSAYTQEYHRYQSLGSAVKAATDAVSISKDLYKNGLKDFNNVLDAQRSRLQLEEAYVISRGQITLDLIQLYRALGGGLEPLK